MESAGEKRRDVLGTVTPHPVVYGVWGGRCAIHGVGDCSSGHVGLAMRILRIRRGGGMCLAFDDDARVYQHVADIVAADGSQAEMHDDGCEVNKVSISLVIVNVCW
jgi:hypothetical protein